MKEKVISVPDWAAAIKKIETLGKRPCWIFIEEDLIPKHLLIKRKIEGYFFFAEKGYRMELSSIHEENEKYWLSYYLFKGKTVKYFIDFFEEEIYYYISKSKEIQ